MGNVVGKGSVRYKTKKMIEVVSEDRVVKVLRVYRDHSGLRMSVLLDIVVIDRRSLGYEVVYVIESVRYSRRISVKVRVKEWSEIETVSELYVGGEWLEREVREMYGIRIKGNKDLRRLLTDYGFSSGVMRKEYPLTGYYEIGYDEERKEVVRKSIRGVSQ